MKTKTDTTIKRNTFFVLALSGLCIVFVTLFTPNLAFGQTSEDRSFGIDGVIPSDAPKVGATISVPISGQTYSEVPITVSGLCSGNVLVKLFKNNVFTGSAECVNGSYSLRTDLFAGQNELVARVFDALDQAGPDSNIVTVTFNDVTFGSFGNRITLTSNFAKRGSNPGDTLTWPISISGGVGPYAVNIEWGDGKSSLVSQPTPGTFNTTHVYDRPGVYNVIVKATDQNGVSAFLQLVGIANGAIQDIPSESDAKNSPTVVRTVWWPALVLFPIILVAFWLGKKYEAKSFRRRLSDM